ncbi:hypothetical protein BSKO_11378 [Bryopsis sp. KO-2023]|nr:hypothetical protein BSKO_11378 [Bryopsis sp. KO-2023]
MVLSLGMAWATTFAISVSAILCVVELGKKGVINRLLARKIMHIGTGPAYLLCWYLFPESPWSPFVASSTILILVLFFVAVGMGLISSQPLVAVVSRSGKKSELLTGPVLYGIVHIAAPLMYWFRSPTGFVALMVLCVGDGVADVVGRKYGGKNPLPWNKSKSLAGSGAFWVGGYLGTLAIGEVFFQSGHLASAFREDFELKSAFMVTVAALVESLPLGGIDNITIFMACVACGKICSW